MLHNGRLTEGQREAVKLILSSNDRTVGVQGYAGTGKTTMLNRARALAEKSGYRVIGLAPSASAARTFGTEAGIESERLQRFLARNADVAEGRLTTRSERGMRAAFRKTVLVVDEGLPASTVQARDLLGIADTLRIPRVVLVGDEKQLDAVDAGKPFAQLQRAGMKTAVMDEILRQKDAELKAAVRASLASDVRGAFEKLGDRVAEVKPDNLAGAAAARWLGLSPRERENTGLMAPSHELRQAVNGHIRERLARDGAIHGAALDVERLVSYGYTGLMAPSHELRQAVNGHIRERLARDGAIHGAALDVERLVSYGYTDAEKSLAANYAPGDVVAFHRAYKSLGVEKGEERRVARVDHARGTVILEGEGKEEDRCPGGPAAWAAGAAPSRSTAPRGSSCAPETASAGPGTTPGSASSTATPPRSRRFGGTASRSGTGGGSNSGTRNSNTWITPGRPPCMPSRGARWTTSSPSWRRTIRA